MCSGPVRTARVDPVCPIRNVVASFELFQLYRCLVSLLRFSSEVGVVCRVRAVLCVLFVANTSTRSGRLGGRGRANMKKNSETANSANK